MLQTNTESHAIRFAPHLELLHDFLRSHRVPFGTADDLRAFAARLARPDSFYEDTSAILRTVILRENMGLSRHELLDLLCIAVGGPQYDQVHSPTGTSAENEIGQLLVFVNVVLLSVRKRSVEAGPEVHATQERTPQQPEMALPVAEVPPPLHLPQIRASATREGAHQLHGGNQEVDFGSSSSPETDVSLKSGVPASTYSAAREHGPPSPPDEAKTEAEKPSFPLDRTQMGSGTMHTRTSSLREGPDRLSEPVQRSTPQGRVRLSRPATIAAAAVLLLLAAAMFLYPRLSRQARVEPGMQTVAGSRGTHIGSPEVPATTQGKGPEPDTTTAGVDRGTAAASGAGASVTPPGEAKSSSQKPGTEKSGVGDESSRDDQETGLASGTGKVTPDLPDASSSTSAATGKDASARSEDRSASRESERETRDEAREAFSVQRSSRKGLFSVSSGVMGANLVSAPEPDYPVLARLTRVEGQVILQAVISRHGTVVATHVLQGHHLLRSAAESCVRKWRYRPYLVNGRPTVVETIVFVNFQLHR